MTDKDSNYVCPLLLEVIDEPAEVGPAPEGYMYHKDGYLIPIVPAVFEGWVIAVDEREEPFILESNGQWDALEFTTGGTDVYHFKEAGFTNGVYKIDFKIEHTEDYYGECDSSLVVVKEEVLWKPITKEEDKEDE